MRQCAHPFRQLGEPRDVREHGEAAERGLKGAPVLNVVQVFKDDGGDKAPVGVRVRPGEVQKEAKRWDRRGKQVQGQDSLSRIEISTKQINIAGAWPP